MIRAKAVAKPATTTSAVRKLVTKCCHQGLGAPSIAGRASNSIHANHAADNIINAKPKGRTLRGSGATGIGPENRVNQMPNSIAAIGPMRDISRCNDHPSIEVSNELGWAIIAITSRTRSTLPASLRLDSLAITRPMPSGSRNTGSQYCHRSVGASISTSLAKGSITLKIDFE